MAETDEDKVRRYTECLMNGIETKRALKRLFDLNVPLNVFQSADTYRFVKRYESSPDFAKYAKRMRDKLRSLGDTDIRKRDHDDDNGVGMKKPKKEEPNTDELFAMAMGGSSSASRAPPRATVDYSKYKVTKRPVEVKVEVKTETEEHHEPSSSHESKKPKEYAPSLPPSLLKPPQHHKPAIPMSASLRVDESQFKPRKDRQKVFAGRRKKIGEEVPTLIALCQDVIACNLQFIDHVGVVPYNLLKSPLLNASVDQLRRILDANPDLASEADELFFDMVKREFPKYAEREKDGWSWREKYDQLVERKQKKESAKLEMLTSRIGKAHTGSDQGRRTMVIDMAHTRVRSKSFFNSVKDTQVKMLNTPTAIQLSQARKTVKSAGKAQLSSITPRGGGAVSSSRKITNNNGQVVVKKTAPLMAKCKKMLKR